MSMELPVAAFDVGALSEILGDPAVLAPAGDGSSLADIVHDLLEDRSRMVELGTANRERAVERFSVQTMVTGYSQVYDELLSDSSAPRSGGVEAPGLR
jgi:glycosyltransferase involved in cell wall biosynthesis